MLYNNRATTYIYEPVYELTRILHLLQRKNTTMYAGGSRHCSTWPILIRWVKCGIKHDHNALYIGIKRANNAIYDPVFEKCRVINCIRTA